MFVEIWESEDKPSEVLGFIQTEDKGPLKTEYMLHLVACKIDIFGKEKTYHLFCSEKSSQKSEHGKVIHASQMFDPRNRRIAMVFDSAPHTVYVFYVWPDGFAYYGEKEYPGDAGNQVTGIAIERGKVFVVLEYAKRVDVFSLEDIHNLGPDVKNPQPQLEINNRVMRFYGVKYFAPVGIKVSRFHTEFIFLKTKTGVMAISVNDDYVPELVFTLETRNIEYDFEINRDRGLIISEDHVEFWEIYPPLRRIKPPAYRYKQPTAFELGHYD